MYFTAIFTNFTDSHFWIFFISDSNFEFICRIKRRAVDQYILNQILWSSRWAVFSDLADKTAIKIISDVWIGCIHNCMNHRTLYESSEGTNNIRNYRRTTNQIRDSYYLKTCPPDLNFAFNRDLKRDTKMLDFVNVTIGIIAVIVVYTIMPQLLIMTTLVLIYKIYNN